MSNSLLRRRILGAFVMVCLGVILWPIFFTDVPGPFVDTSSEIPASRTFAQFEVPEPQIPKDIPPVELPSREDSQSIAADQQEQEPPQTLPEEIAAKPELDARGLPVAHVIQVGSFADAKNAESLKSKLLNQGYRAYTEVARTDAGQTVRVYVGPMVSKKQCLDEKDKIDKAFNLKSKVVRYVP